jgi:tryptophan-tRNA ligase
MAANYRGGNYGFGHAKTALYELILEKFAQPREKFAYYMDHISQVDEILREGAEKASQVAKQTLQRVREKLGYL